MTNKQTNINIFFQQHKKAKQNEEETQLNELSEKAKFSLSQAIQNDKENNFQSALDLYVDSSEQYMRLLQCKKERKRKRKRKKEKENKQTKTKHNKK